MEPKKMKKKVKIIEQNNGKNGLEQGKNSMKRIKRKKSTAFF